MDYSFSAHHRGGAGTPMVCLHGFTGTWRAWDPVLGALERHHDVLAPTLPGHAGGPPLPQPDGVALLDGLERIMDEAGFATAHLVGNSLGGYLALALAARGRARTVVALAPAGGWADDSDGHRETLAVFSASYGQLRAAAPQADAIAASPQGRRLAMHYLVSDGGRLPAELVAHLIAGAARCDATLPLIEHALREGWPLDAQRVGCPVRFLWGTADRLLAWPSAAARYRRDWPTDADWVALDGVGHCPQLEIPLETAQLILGMSSAEARAQ